ncbi:hypothetical protein [Solidesulfovibrio alcoholivorans]|uniref:hypothetical protein n=1 Tax=Solidesulfovibrio alcoholivorans TaxID=81406 RepID=UPI000693D695|nr:hypothetical protein [Solidesulfovibrio alcoholivorans]
MLWQKMSENRASRVQFDVMGLDNSLGQDNGSGPRGIARAPGHARTASSRTGRLIAALVLAALTACSRAPEPVAGFGDLAFGAPRPADCAALAVPLPQALAGSLVYCAKGGGAEFAGAVLTDVTLGFFEGRFFVAAAVLADPGQAHALAKRLTTTHGRPYCRDRGAVCLWRMGDADAVLETPQAGPPRLLVRSRSLAGRVAAAGGESAAAAMPALGDAPGSGDAPPAQ